MGRGLGIFPARPKAPFVPGGGFTRDKRPPPYIFFLPPSPFPQTLVSFGVPPPSVPLLPPPLELPEHRRRQRRRPEPRRASPTSPSAAGVDVRHPGPGPVPPRLRRPGLHSARTPSSSPPPVASTTHRRAATLSAARHRAASSPPRRPGPCHAPS